MNLTTLNQSTVPTYQTFKPRVLMSARVYADILTLVHNYSSEIGWQGYVRVQNKNTYVIEEILVYPQRVTGATVEDDHEKFAAWIGQIPIDKLNAVRLYGHSHVNMAVNPSGTDIAQFQTYKEQTDDFYVMMIVNKKNEFRIDIYDKATNQTFIGCEFLISYDENKELLAEAEKLVERKVYTYQPRTYGSRGYYPGTAGPLDDFFTQQNKQNQQAQPNRHSYTSWYDEPEIEDDEDLNELALSYYNNRQQHKAARRGRIMNHLKGGNQ